MNVQRRTEKNGVAHILLVLLVAEGLKLPGNLRLLVKQILVDGLLLIQISLRPAHNIYIYIKTEWSNSIRHDVLPLHHQVCNRETGE